MSRNDLTPIHQCYFLGQEQVEPVHILTQYLIRNPQFARQRHPDCEVIIYVVPEPVDNCLVPPARCLRRIVTTIGEIRAAASAITGESFENPPPTPALIAARKAKKALKKARQAERR